MYLLDRLLKKYFVIFIVPLLLLTGCNAQKDHLTVFNRLYQSNDYQASCDYAQAKISKSNHPKAEDLLWTLQLASLERFNQNYSRSTAHFDRAEDMLKYFDLKDSDATDAIGAMAINDNIVPYKGQEYDGVMVNTYKALNFLAERKMDLARVEFNRALDRQRRAKEKFSKEIAKLQQEINQKQQQDANIQKNVDNPEIQDKLNQAYPCLNSFEAYPDFVNPFTTYLAGIYFNLAGDYSQANFLFKESLGMVDNNYIAEDLKATDDILAGVKNLENTTWLIYENGLGPIKEEFRIDLPLFIVTQKILYTGIALPKLEFRPSASPYLRVEAQGQTYDTTLVASMDRVIQTEFKKDYQAILIRAIVSAAAKAAAQYMFQDSNQSGGAFLAIGMAIYNFATTAADVRIWTTLPKEFQIARFTTPSDRKLKITPSGMGPFSIDIPCCNNSIVYVKIPFNGANPVIEIMTF